MSAQAAATADDVRQLVMRCCPQLKHCVDEWLLCYKDPALLYASLEAEYYSSQPELEPEPPAAIPEEPLFGAAPRSSAGLEEVPSALFGAAPPASAGVPSATARASRSPRRSEVAGNHGGQKMYKTKLCERFLLETGCRWGASCTFAHGDQELKFWRAEARQSHQDQGRPSHGRKPPVQLLADGTGAAAAVPPRMSIPPALPNIGPSSEMHMLPSEIGFCHDTVNHIFRNGQPILTTLFELASQRICLRDIPPMQVVLHNDNFYSVSNRRLCLYRLCEHLDLISKDQPVKVKLLENYPLRFEEKFTTPCSGDWVRVRHDGRICGRTRAATSFGVQELSNFWPVDQS
eukprot:gnl/TRDRNA2_/TRDRNA2_169984_c1_seq2.p1 gnl/TRDRNA2_/TRDRNA2_169984_c1~~gnl/TRDRNA2_/TRDRNA2_169984_c1_seq2.p1  ORF type:complete len:358 (-),score=57.28 gnl/TRDRNA2_/TRDRNA2_169984_c1_seq2:30-1067(-)